LTIRLTAWLSIAATLLACGPDREQTVAPAPESPAKTAIQTATEERSLFDSRLADWDERVEMEEWIHARRPALRDLERSLRNLVLPDLPARSRFDAVVEVRDVDAAGIARESVVARLGLGVRALAPAQPQAPAAPSALRVWRAVLDDVDHLERANVAIADARALDEGGTRIATNLTVTARGSHNEGHRFAFVSDVEAEWVRRGDASDPDAWRMATWKTQSLTLTDAPRRLFREALDTAIPDREVRERARTSRHERMVGDKLLRPDEFRRPHRHFFQGSQDRHPGIAVSDVNGDGFDDLYVMARWGANQLFVSRGDGRFDERAAEYGLDLSDHASSAIFADFDNDGDPDLFLGRTLSHSHYFENENGRFVDRGQSVFEGAPPSLVSSVSAADVDGDGLLDLYVATYAAQMIVSEMLERERVKRSGVSPARALLSDHLGEPFASQLYARTQQAGAHIFLSLPGPPNALLRNLGEGRFRVERDGPLASFRNTYQATWSDFDADGDPDVYLAHDFAPNQLLRNDDGSFVDVTEASGTADIGFGMGVSWGDYDHDGRPDLYVSNMYSKAGKRITRGLDDFGSELPKMARGNSLFRNTGERFEKVSGVDDDALQVEAAGWSWGGQFGDVDNDGFPDLTVLAGYYTAPPEAALDVDV
jgi:hypothetical protein